jgi:DNA-binding LytR/AlgR family response regulator
LDDTQFFRANRQTIIHRFACKSYRRMENGKIGLDLEPNPKIPVIISQKRASDFRKWIAGQSISPIPDILQD